jgi:hypothetical protein
MTNRYFCVIGKIPLYFGVLEDKFLGHNWVSNDVMVHWLRPQTHIEWFPHPLVIYKVFGNINMVWGCR